MFLLIDINLIKKIKYYKNKKNLLCKDYRKYYNKYYNKYYKCTKCNYKIDLLVYTMYDYPNYSGEFYIQSLIFGDFIYHTFYESCYKYLYSYKFDKNYFPKDEIEAFKIIKRIISNSIFQ